MKHINSKQPEGAASGSGYFPGDRLDLLKPVVARLAQRILATAVLTALTTHAVAEAEPGAAAQQLQEDPQTGQELTGEPEIEIRYGENETRYEYRVNGELVQVKVQPKVGPAYYLIPGQDGALVQSDGPNPSYPTWKLFQW
ncbi:DUF2782 domain-containing protein [Allohahella marinimesophila]|uniref:DUF2782 domain-containing protein n=1 Tax=Allohahella marinimesophila TaxID=1054972 RepID=UPI0031D5C8B8